MTSNRSGLFQSCHARSHNRLRQIASPLTNQWRCGLSIFSSVFFFFFFLRLDLDPVSVSKLRRLRVFRVSSPAWKTCTGALPLAGLDVDVPSLEIEVLSNSKMGDEVLRQWQGYPNGTRAPSRAPHLIGAAKKLLGKQKRLREGAIRSTSTFRPSYKTQYPSEQTSPS